MRMPGWAQPSWWIPRGLAIGLIVGAATILAGLTDAGRATPEGSASLVAVGDIASCSRTEDERVAALVATLPGTIAILGDSVYESGTDEEFARCFLPAWGRFRSRIRATLGNHEYETQSAAPAIRIFGLPPNGWYAYRLGPWKVIVLNSNCDEIGGCQRGSRQWNWLRQELARRPRTACTLAYWHHPRFSSGKHGSDVRLAALWDLLAAARADLVLSGHDHDYERFAPLKGIRSFVVGTGGKDLYELPDTRRVGSQAGDASSFGVLQLELRATSFTWRFVGVPGSTFTDRGNARCR
jgi:acid phosphatase type 7